MSDDTGAERRPLQGRLLVASPLMLDPNFFRSVVLILEHSPDEGAVGLVLNHPTELEVAAPLEAWATLARAAPPPVIYSGGPVKQDAVIALALATSDHPVDGFQPHVGRLGTVDLGRPPDLIQATLEAVRIFAGYAGWSGGQLESELIQEAWLVCDLHDDAMSDDPGSLWRHVVQRQGGKTAWLANFPLHPRFN